MIPGNAIPDIIRQAIFGCVSDPLTQKTVNKNHMRHQLTPPAAATDAPDPIASQDVNDLPRIGPLNLAIGHVFWDAEMLNKSQCCKNGKEVFLPFGVLLGIFFPQSSYDLTFTFSKT